MSGYVLAISYHHMLELIQHGSEREASARLFAISKIPLLAVVAGEPERCSVGTVIEVQTRELAAALRKPLLAASGVAEVARGTMFELTTGEKLAAQFLDVFVAIRALALEHEKRTRATASLTQAVSLDQHRTPFRRDGLSNSPTQVYHNLLQLRGALSEELRTRGDQRIDNPDAVGASFVADLAQLVPTISSSPDAVAAILGTVGLRPEDVEGLTTVGEIAELTHFRKMVEVSAQYLNVPLVQLFQIDQNRVPSWIIQRALHRHRHVASEARGSDLGDGYLLCLAPYCNATFVDKRTFENVRQMARHDTQAKSLLVGIRKAPSWREALAQLDAAS